MANYQIKSGDTLSQIAQANNTTVANLQGLNPQITDPNKIYAGQNLVISAEALKNGQTPATLPTQAPDTTNYPAVLSSLTPAPTSGGIPDYLKSYLDAQSPPPNTADTYATEYKNAGIDQKTQQVNDLSTMLNNINTQAQVANQTLESQASGKDVTTQFLGRQQQEINRQAAIKGLPVAAQLQAAQGNLQAAQSHLDTLFKIKSGDAQRQYDYKQNLIKSVYDIADKEQQRLLDAKKIENANEFTQKMEEIHQQNAIELQKLQQQGAIGLENLRNQNDIKLENVKAGLKPTTQVVSPSAVTNPLTGQPVDQAVLDNLNKVNTLLNNSNLGSIFGAVKQFTGGLFGAGAEVKAQYDQIKGILSLDNRKMLKGSGAISDFESKTLEQASSALARNLTPEAARKQLVQIKGAFQTATGGQAKVKIIDPVSKQSKTGMVNRNDINQAISAGYQVEYSE